MRWIARHRQDPGYAAWAEERAGATRQDPNEPKWIEARAAEYVAFAHEAYHVGRITLYRALRLSKNRDGAYPIDLNCLGKSWSRFRRTADVYGASWRRGDDLLITGHVSPSDVDWPYSFRSFLHYGPDQWEVSLLAHSPVEIESIERDGDLVQGPTLGSSGPAGEEWNEECGPKTSSSYKSNPASTSAPPPPFAFVADLGPVLLAQGRRGLVGEAYDGTVFDLSERDILHAVNILPGAAVFPFLHAEGLLTRRERSEPRFSRTGPRLVAANPLGLVGGRGARFEPLPEGVASGFPRARQEIERYRAEVPTTRVIILSMAFALSTVRTNIASAERAFACYGERYHTTQGPPSYDDILDCFTLYGQGLAPSKTETLRGIAPYGETIESAMLLGLRDRDLRRHLATATDLPPGLSLAKLSFTLALLGQNVICLDARLLGTMFDAEEQETFNRRTKKADKGPSRGRLRQDAVDAYEEAEDLFLDGNRYYDPSDPLGQARAQWMSWESVGEKSKTGTLHRRGMRWQVVPAEHAVWIDVVSQGELRSPYDARLRSLTPTGRHRAGSLTNMSYSTRLGRRETWLPNPMQPYADQARELASYLNTEIDPYDFGYMLPKWSGSDQEQQVDDLSEADKARFVRWLRGSDRRASPLDDLMQEAPTDVPSYLYFNNAKPLGPKAWCVHFTKRAFSSFVYGATVEMLGLSTHFRTHPMANCRKNLEDDIGLFERVFGFAFSADKLRRYGHIEDAQRKYGRGAAVLFQTDAGVEARHLTDNEDQVIFPLCSEYNVHEVSFDGSNVMIDGEDDVRFDSLDDAIWHLENESENEIARG